jgi:hypothetical protein
MTEEMQKFDVLKYPTMAKVAPFGEFVGRISLITDAVNTLSELNDIAEFGRELVDWFSALRAEGDEPIIVGQWISYVVGHFDSDVSDKWGAALPQANLGTGFMPTQQTIQLESYNKNTSNSLKSNLRSAFKFILRK